MFYCKITFAIVFGFTTRLKRKIRTSTNRILM